MLLVNLLPWRKRRLRRRARRWLTLLLLQLALAALVLAGYYIILHQQRLVLQRELGDISERQRQLTLQYQQTRRMWNQLRDYQAQHDADAAALRHNQRYLNLLDRITAMLPRRLWLTEIADRGQHLLISGLSENYADIVVFNRSLVRHPELARVQVLEALRQQKDRALLSFSLQADWIFTDSAGGEQAGD
ncbi:PilN domain-containing protein [Brenneria goodwinii]|uniref:PilN domain-containing protein n=1 Tax=Brenneria goodwinii TaxID=1109412 RepID=UPI0036ECF96D